MRKETHSASMSCLRCITNWIKHVQSAFMRTETHSASMRCLRCNLFKNKSNSDDYTHPCLRHTVIRSSCHALPRAVTSTSTLSHVSVGHHCGCIPTARMLFANIVVRLAAMLRLGSAPPICATVIVRQPVGVGSY